MTKKTAHEAMELVQTALESIGIDDQRENIGKAIDALMEIREAGIVEPDPPQRFLHVSGTEVFAYFYDRARSRFLILAFNKDAVHPWVVATTRNLTDSEWDAGRHMATYGNAVDAWRKKITY